MRKIITRSLLVCILSFSFLKVFDAQLYACTSAIISGKATADGRPILWKHRDSDFEENKLMHFSGGKYDYTGIVNSKDAEGKEIWMGSNSAGFSIMNTASYNLNQGEKIGVPDDQEGLLIKAALAECATVQDFENFLKRGKGKWGISANFGVIDAKGGAAYFETGYYSFTKYDVNDPMVAPNGYLLRTNYSFSGVKNKGYGYVRYLTAEELFYWNNLKNNISVEFILRDADRSLRHSLLKNDLYNAPLPEDSSSYAFIPFRDYIVRNSSVSTMIIQGVKAGEDPKLTTLWTVLGFQMTTLVVPVWVASGDKLPEVLVAHEGKTAPINEKSLVLKRKCFPIEYDNGKDYLNLAVLLNKKGSGIAQKLLPKEAEIVQRTGKLLGVMRSNGFDSQSVSEHYKWLDTYVLDTYKSQFGI